MTENPITLLKQIEKFVNTPPDLHFCGITTKAIEINLTKALFGK